MSLMVQWGAAHRIINTNDVISSGGINGYVVLQELSHVGINR